MIMKVFKCSLTFFTILFFLSIPVTNAINPNSDNESNESGIDETDIGLSDFSGRFEKQRRKPKLVDSAYELGKSVYYGRKDGTPKLSYCIISEGNKQKLKRKAVKPYKNTSFSELAINLYNCDVPEKKIKTELQRDDFLHVLYYIDSRYKLNLKRE